MSTSSVSSGGNSSLAKASTAEREADQRIQAAQQRVKAANEDADMAINHIKDQYEKQTLAEDARTTDKIESQRNRGYEQLRDLQRQQQSQLRKMRRDGERDTSQLQEYYRTKVHQTEMSSNQQLNEIQTQSQHRMEHEKAVEASQLEEVQQKHTQQMNLVQKNSDEQLTQLGENTRRRYDELKAQTDEVQVKYSKDFEERIGKTLNEQQETLNRINSNASQTIKDIRKDTSQKLSAYRSRQSDPFYKLMDLNARLMDAGDEFVLKATIPEYEQQHVSAVVKGNNLVLTGYRRNEETLDMGHGHKQGTASFQSFHESFPLSWPVESRLLSREFVGDTLVVRVPKKNEYVYQSPKLDKPEKIRVEPPRFPNNIEKSKESQEKKNVDDDGNPIPARRRPGSGTLS
jgi:HSP20 family molecular chaperone IbpA